MEHFADRLARAIRTKGNAVCVGLDPRWESLPDEVRSRHGGGSLAAVLARRELDRWRARFGAGGEHSTAGTGHPPPSIE